MMANNGLSIFNYRNAQVRTYTDESGETWFLAADVCSILEIVNSRDVVSRMPDDEKRDVGISDTTGRIQKMTVISEPGLYRLIFRSTKPEAEVFRKWIFSEVLPAIRKTGQYNMQALSPLEILEQQVALMRAQGMEIKQLDIRVTRVEATISTMDESHMTIKGYCSYKHYQGCNENIANKLGRQAAKLSRERGYGIGETMDQKYGRINNYHLDILAEVVDPFFGK